MTETDQLKELRAHYAHEIDEIDRALGLLQRVSKMSKKAERQVGQIRRKRVTAAEPATNGHGRANGQPGLTAYQRMLIAKQNGMRPTDVLRRIFDDAKGKELQQTDIAAIFRDTTNGTYRENQINRIVGLALRRLRVDREIKQTRTGFVAKRLQVAE